MGRIKKKLRLFRYLIHQKQDLFQQVLGMGPYNTSLRKSRYKKTKSFEILLKISVGV